MIGQFNGPYSTARVPKIESCFCCQIFYVCILAVHGSHILMNKLGIIILIYFDLLIFSEVYFSSSIGDTFMCLFLLPLFYQLFGWREMVFEATVLHL